MLNPIRDTINAVLADVSKDDGKSGPSREPYEAEKGSVLLQTRMFNESPLHPDRCFDCLTKILVLLTNKGESFTELEESDLFFGITKLFQSNNDRLRRMVYLAIKTLNINENEAFIVTSCLTKDINSGSDAYRANALRVLSKIVDSSMANQIERYLEAAIVDKSAFVASSALVCAMNLLRTSSPELVKRWVNEVTESVRNRNPMVQFHALALLYELKKTDRLALHKVVSSLTSSPLKSPMAECLLIRYSAKIFADDYNSVDKRDNIQKTLSEYLYSRLHHRSETVILEAARSICELAASPFGRDRLPLDTVKAALVAMQVLLTSPKSVVRFAAMRVLNAFSKTQPQLVSACNSDIEALLIDPNRCVAILALTTLLKTGKEAGVERLIRQITLLMTDIPDSFKLEVIRATRQLSSTYPSQFKCFLDFMSTQLREEGILEVKREIVETIASLITTMPQTLESGLLHLCEFIEDCEYVSLSIRVLSLVGQLASRTTNPAKFIRFVYNRLVLECAAVRAAAVDALTRIGNECPKLRRDIVILLENCLWDADDEIRDRTCLCYKMLNSSLDNTSYDEDDATTCASLSEILKNKPPFAVDVLIDLSKRWLEQAGSGGDAAPAMFSFDDLPTEDEYKKQLAAEAAAAAATAQKASQTPKGGVLSSAFIEPLGSPSRGAAAALTSTSPLPAPSEDDKLVEMIRRLAPHLFEEAADVVPSHSSNPPPIPLTEKEAEYPVTLVKHFFSTSYVLLQFNVTNTMNDQSLHNVQIELTSYESQLWQILGSTAIEDLYSESEDELYILVTSNSKALEEIPTLSTFVPVMRFIVKEQNDDLGLDDSYTLEVISISIADFIASRSYERGQFDSHWQMLGEPSETLAMFNFGYRSLATAVEAIHKTLGLAACEESNVIQSDSGSSHTLLLAGVLPNSTAVLLCKANIVMSTKHGCIVKVACRSKNKKIGTRVLELFG